MSKDSSNGVSGEGAASLEAPPRTERQHCPACNTDGEHVYLMSDTWACRTCNDPHSPVPVARRGSTIEENRALVAVARDSAAAKIPDVSKIVDETIGGPVNHPKHYNVGKIEVIDAIEDWKLGFNLGNAVKYIARAAHKGTQLEDLRKSRWYLTRQITLLEQEAAAASTAPQGLL